MNSNKFFSIRRFYLLLRNDILLNHKKYLLVIAGAFILGFVFLYMQMPKVERLEYDYWYFNRNRYQVAFIMCLLALAAFIGSSFSELSSKVKTSNYLLMPASTLEKFLSQFVIRVILGTAIFLFVFWVDAHLARTVALSQIEGPNHEPPSANVSKCISVFHYSMFLVKKEYPTVTYWNWFDGVAMLFGFFSIGMYFFSVKLFFKKLGLIKTGISLIAIVYLGTVVMMLLSHIFYPETKGFDVSDEMDYKLPNGLINIETWMYISAYCLSLFIIPFGYFKLKEKQV